MLVDKDHDLILDGYYLDTQQTAKHFDYLGEMVIYLRHVVRGAGQ
jgi:hypothetical protein